LRPQAEHRRSVRRIAAFMELAPAADDALLDLVVTQVDPPPPAVACPAHTQSPGAKKFSRGLNYPNIQLFNYLRGLKSLRGGRVDRSAGAAAAARLTRGRTAAQTTHAAMAATRGPGGHDPFNEDVLAPMFFRGQAREDFGTPAREEQWPRVSLSGARSPSAAQGLDPAVYDKERTGKVRRGGGVSGQGAAGLPQKTKDAIEAAWAETVCLGAAASRRPRLALMLGARIATMGRWERGSGSQAWRRCARRGRRSCSGPRCSEMRVYNYVCAQLCNTVTQCVQTLVPR
jgi:hypothetical protein